MNKRSMIQAGVTAAALAAVVTGTALAAGTIAPTEPATNATDADDVDEQDPVLDGSIQFTEDESLTEAEETAQLESLDGLIGPDAAITAATADGGTADTATLENENGSVVYEVEVTNDDTTVEEVKVDAGNGDVLEREVEDADDDEDDEDDEDDDGVDHEEEGEHEGENGSGQG